MKKITAILAFVLLAVTTKAQYKIGDTATDFKLSDTEGKSVSLADYTDAKGYIIVFTCNTCPYAVAYQDRIVDLDKKYKNLGYPVIAINPNDPEVQPKDAISEMAKRSVEKGFTFPYLQDLGQKVYPAYGALKTPHVFILKKEEGKNIVKYIGAIDDNYEDPLDVTDRYVEDAVNALLSGNKVLVDNTTAVGCTIKVKK